MQIYSIKLAWQFVQEAVSSVTKMHCEFKAQICATVRVLNPTYVRTRRGSSGPTWAPRAPLKTDII